jgi:hypothetical protein
MRHRRNQRSRQRGQAAILISLCLFSMVVFLALATNMGILVNDRIRMQNTADLAAYAGAFEQARALNRLTWLNKRIFIAADDIRKHLTCRDLPDLQDMKDPDSSCDKSGKWRTFPRLNCDNKLPEGILKVGQIRMDIIAAIFQLENYRAKETSHRAALFTARGNFRGTDRPRHSNFFEWNPDSPTFRGKPLVDVHRVKTQYIYAMGSWFGHCGCKKLRGCIKVYDENTKGNTLDTWFVKDRPGPTVFFPARLMGTPEKEFLDIKNRRGGYFGGDAERGILHGSDDLWAFAVAKPYGGNLGPDNGNGAKNHLKFRWLLTSAGANSYDYDSFEDANLRPKFVEQYRARMAGIQDNMMDGATGKKKSPIDLMMIDLKRASHAREDDIRQYTLH